MECIYITVKSSHTALTGQGYGSPEQKPALCAQLRRSETRCRTAPRPPRVKGEELCQRHRGDRSSESWSTTQPRSLSVRDRERSSFSEVWMPLSSCRLPPARATQNTQPLTHSLPLISCAYATHPASLPKKTSRTPPSPKNILSFSPSPSQDWL